MGERENNAELCIKSDIGRNDTNTIFIMEAEKIICCDGARNNDALAWAAMANKGNDPMAMAAMMNGGMNNWNNSPWMYLIFLALFGGNGFGFGNRNGQLQDAEIQSKLNQLSTQLQDGNNTNLLMDAIKGNNVALGQLASNLNCDFNQMQSGICAVQAAIQQVGGQVGYSAERVINAVNLGDMNIVQQLKDCCCQTQQNIIKMGYENQLGQKDILNGMQQQTNTFERSLDFVNRSIERGFSSLGYQLAQDKCDIIRAGQDNTRLITDTLNNHWTQDLRERYQDARLELSQQRQNATLIAALGTKATTATT